MDNIRPWLTANREIDDRNKIIIYPREELFEQSPRLQDARLSEPATVDFTMTKFDRYTQKMDIIRAIWVTETRCIQTSQLDLSRKSKGAKSLQPFGQPQYNYNTYHTETIALLRPGKEDLDALIDEYERKRRRDSKAISEKSSMVELKSGNAQERMVETMITSMAKEIGNQAFREAGADRRLERAEEIEYAMAIERARPRVGLEGWRGAGWWRGED